MIRGTLRPDNRGERPPYQGTARGLSTETVYGLGANGLDSAQWPDLRRQGTSCGQPPHPPRGLFQRCRQGGGGFERAASLIELFWPGPLTLVLASRGAAPTEVTAGLGTVAVRMPSHPVALALISASGAPLAAPSANSSGRPSPTDAAAVAADLGERADLILDGGATSVGVESTVLDVTGSDLVLLRPGGCPVEEIEAAAGMKIIRGGGEAGRSPGTRYRHYAPSVPMVLHDEKDARERALALGGRIAWIGMDGPEILFAPGEADRELSLVFTSPENYARGLFHALRVLENSGAAIIAAQRPESDAGIGLALIDRLERASGGSGAGDEN